MVVQKMTFHEIQIDSPEEIYGAVKHTAEQSETRLYRVALDHHHTSTVRGYGERKTSLDDRLGEEVELRREDGGNTWYHSPESRCIMLGVPDQNDRNAEEMMKAWGEALSEKLEEYSDQSNNLDPVYLERDGNSIDEAWDVYDRNSGRQLFGLSMRSFDESTVVRTCFYDGDNHGQLFQDMVEEDEQDYNEFKDRYVTLEGFYEWLTDGEIQSISPQLENGNVEADDSIRRSPNPCIVKVEDFE